MWLTQRVNLFLAELYTEDAWADAWDAKFFTLFSLLRKNSTIGDIKIYGE